MCLLQGGPWQDTWENGTKEAEGETEEAEEGHQGKMWGKLKGGEGERMRGGWIRQHV